MTNQQQYSKLLADCANAADQFKAAEMLGMPSGILAALEQASKEADDALDAFQGGEDFSDDFLNT